MATIELRIDGLDELISRLTKAPDLVGQELDKALNKSAVVAQREIRRKAPVDTGRLRNSITYMHIGVLAYSVATNVDYALPVHEGSKAHVMPGGAIDGWATRHGMDASAVRWAIARKGTKPNPFFKTGAKAATSDINSYFAAALANVSSRMANG